MDRKVKESSTDDIYRRAGVTVGGRMAYAESGYNFNGSQRDGIGCMYGIGTFITKVTKWKD